MVASSAALFTRQQFTRARLLLILRVEVCHSDRGPAVMSLFLVVVVVVVVVASAAIAIIFVICCCLSTSD